MKTVIENQYLPEFEQHNSWLEHMMYNPSGSRFMFFHRWDKDGRTRTRLYTADSSDGSGLFMFPDTGFYSHADWKSDEELTIWAMEPGQAGGKEQETTPTSSLKTKRLIKTLIRPLYRRFIRPFLSQSVVDRISPPSKLLNYTDKSTDYRLIGGQVLRGNGHQRWSPDRRSLLIDTYEDEKNYRHLFLYDPENEKEIPIGKFYSRYNSCVYRADLHPRFSVDGFNITVDSAHTEKRSQLVLEYPS
jgi:hypothetical protein